MCLMIWQTHRRASRRRLRYWTAERTALPTFHSVESANHVLLDEVSGRWSIETAGRRLETDDKSQLEMYLDELEGGAAC
jgi:hypothetical protein